MPLSAKKMCGAAGVNSSSQVSGASAKSLHPKCAQTKVRFFFYTPPALNQGVQGEAGRGEDGGDAGKEGEDGGGWGCCNF